MPVKVLVAAALVAAIAVPAAAQSLAEIAERARREREAKKKGTAKVITENDLRSGGSGTYSPSAGDPAPSASPVVGTAPAPGTAASAAPGAAPKTEEEQAAERLAAWRERLTKAQSDVTHWTNEVNRLQTALNDMTGPLYGSGRATRQASLEEARRNLATAQQAVNDLTEEGRRNNYR